MQEQDKSEQDPITKVAQILAEIFSEAKAEMEDSTKARRFIMYMIRTTCVKHPYDINGRKIAVQAKGIFIAEVINIL